MLNEGKKQSDETGDALASWYVRFLTIYSVWLHFWTFWLFTHPIPSWKSIRSIPFLCGGWIIGRRIRTKIQERRHATLSCWHCWNRRRFCLWLRICMFQGTRCTQWRERKRTKGKVTLRCKARVKWWWLPAGPWEHRHRTRWASLHTMFPDWPRLHFWVIGCW